MAKKLVSDFPELVAEWDYERNNPLTPEQVTFGSNKKAYWRCKAGHSFQSSVSNRTRLGRGCPYCAGQKALVGVNDLATTNPVLVAEWDYERNSPLIPQEVMAGTEKKVFWLCPEGHSYESAINSRNRGSGCPLCSGQVAISGVNDLATTHPELVAEWDYEKNAPLTPVQVKAGSGKKVFWLCPEGHSYQTVIGSRKAGDGCPVCYNRAVLVGVNDLATTNPELAAEWDYERNSPLTPQQVVSGTHRPVFWLCPQGHSFESVINYRNQGTGCPICTGRSVLAGFNDLASTNPLVAAEWDLEKNAPLMPEQVTKGSNQKVWWLCPQGHSYSAVVVNREFGTGCPSCANYGYDATQVGQLYFIKCVSLNARKIGITNPQRKYDRIAGYGPEWNVIKTYSHFDGQVIRDLETIVLRWLRKDLQMPPYLGKEDMAGGSGHSETFTMDGISDFEVLQKIEDVLNQLTKAKN